MPARETRSGVLVIRGEAGIGKSALLDYAAERANDSIVLRGVGAEAESELAFAALHQIFRPVLGRIENLPEPQARALRSAFALSDETVDDRFRVSLAVLGLLSDVAEEQSLLCLVDDSHWLDAPSADALLFAARRFEAERIALLLATRDDPPSAVAPSRLPELRLRPLSQPEARELLKARLADASAAAVEWLLETAAGNPLSLVELPQLLSREQLVGRAPIAGAPPQITSVEAAYVERVRALSRTTQTLLLIAAADGTGDRTTVVGTAGELGVDPLALAEAEQVGLIRVDSTRVEFRHPLLRSAVYRDASFAERERVHRALAAVLDAPDDADRRAWHRSAATIGPDEDVADELERTAARAALRSGYAAAAAALRRAAELSADAGLEARRLVGSARAAWQGGDPERAAVLLDWASPIVRDRLLRAELEHLRGLMKFWCGSLVEACEILRAAAGEAAQEEPLKALEMLFDAAEAAAWAGDFERMAEIGQQAASVRTMEFGRDKFLANLLIGVGGLFEGKTSSELPMISEVLDHADDFDEPRWLVWAASSAGVAGDAPREADLLRRAVAIARSSGAVDNLTHVLVTVAARGVFEGRLSTAREAAWEGLTLAREAGLSNAAAIHLAVLTWVTAVRGDDLESASYAAEVNELSRTAGAGFANAIAEWGIGLLDLGKGRPTDAAARLASVGEARPGEGQQFVALVSAADLVEAYVRSDRAEEAGPPAARLEGFAGREGPTWAVALAARCRALLEPAPASAELNYQEALRLHADGRRQFDRARTELLYGEHLRRQRRRRESREHLRAALEAFETLGAAPWAERARVELRASGETARKRDPSTVDQLTPQELQIARLVGEGMSNKEVAAQLFLSPRTIDYHLRKVFTKLEITSRTELVRLGVAEEREPAVEAV